MPRSTTSCINVIIKRNNWQNTLCSSGNTEEDETMIQQCRSKIAHKRWSAVHDSKGAIKLKAAMMGHLFKQKFGAHTMSTAYDMVDSYDPLLC